MTVWHRNWLDIAACGKRRPVPNPQIIRGSGSSTQNNETTLCDGVRRARRVSALRPPPPLPSKRCPLRSRSQEDTVILGESYSLIWLLALPAFALEVTFYASLASDRIRARFERLPPLLFATLLTVSAILPYCLATLAFGTFRWPALGWISMLAGAVSFWYILLPKKPAADILLLVFMATVWIAGLFKHWYWSPNAKLYLPVLGQLMWFRTGLFAMLAIRRVQGVGFGFWPSGREWKIGAVHFAIFLPLAAVLARSIGFASPRM